MLTLYMQYVVFSQRKIAQVSADIGALARSEKLNIFRLWGIFPDLEFDPDL